MHLASRFTTNNNSITRQRWKCWIQRSFAGTSSAHGPSNGFAGKAYVAVLLGFYAVSDGPRKVNTSSWPWETTRWSSTRCRFCCLCRGNVSRDALTAVSFPGIYCQVLDVVRVVTRRELTTGTRCRAVARPWQFSSLSSSSIERCP